MAPIPPQYRIRFFRGYLEREWEFLVIFCFSMLVGLTLIVVLESREFMFEDESLEPERFARITLGGPGPKELPAGEPAAAPGKVIAKEPAPSPRKVAEKAEAAKVGKVIDTRNKILQQSLVGVIATRSKLANSALARVLDKGGIGSEVEQSLKNVNQKGVVAGGGGTALESRGVAGPTGAGGGGGAGLGGLGGIGTGYGGGGDDIQLGIKSTHKVTATLTRGAASVEGSLDAGLIDQVVRKNLSGLKYCYEKELNQSPKLAGKILVQFVIGLSGEVTEVTIENSSLSNPAVEDCVSRRIRRWRFPRPDGGSVIVSYPFVFTAAS